MDNERNYYNYGLLPSEEYFREKKKVDDKDAYSPLEQPELLHY